MSGGWRPARCCSVIGAAHRRRGQPCQDASLAIALSGLNGEPLQLMAVADGHGNRRHWLSQVGSSLACHQAELAVREALAHTPLTAVEHWRRLLQEALPQRISQGWLAAAAADWAGRPEASQQPFSAAVYGCTLGLVLMAPRWWGHTGLGDWDLVAIDGAGQASLISEEPASPAGGEATASLCLPEAAGLCSARSALHGLQTPETALSLVLSSDGVRKSCATDADFLQLCTDLAGIASVEELAEGLALITAEGSGDDVSVALGHHPGVAGAPEATTATATATDTDTDTVTGPGGGRRPLIAAGLALALAGGGLGVALLRAAPPASPPGPDPPLAQHQPASPLQPPPPAVTREIARLCADPGRLRATLNQRREQFLQPPPGQTARAVTAATPTAPAAPATAAERDPLGALIAASRRGPLPGCPELERELRRQWQLAAGLSPGDAGAGRMPPARRAP